MKKFGFFVLIIISVITIYFGNAHSNKLEATNKKIALQYELEQKRVQKADEEKKLKKIKKIENSKSVLFTDYVNYLSLKNSDVKIAFIGSSVSAGAGASSYGKSWAGLTVTDIQNFGEEDAIEVQSQNFSAPGFKMADLLNDNRHKELVKWSPDIVFIESCLINSLSQSEEIVTTISNSQKMVDFINKELPKSKIILVESNPVNSKWLATKEKNTKYTDYLTAFENFAIDNKLPVFKTFSSINTEIKSQKLSIEKLLSDDVHPNDLGYSIWNESLKVYLKELKISI